MCEDDNQALTTHAKKGKTKKEEHSYKKPKRFQKNDRPQKEYSNVKYYSCDEKGHLEIDFPKSKIHGNKGNKKRYRSHATEDNEPIHKRDREGSSSDEEYVLISALTGTVTLVPMFGLLAVL